MDVLIGDGLCLGVTGGEPLWSQLLAQDRANVVDL